MRLKNEKIQNIYYYFFFISDTERLYTQITQDIVSKYGKNFTWAIKSRQMGKKETEASKIIIGTYYTLCFSLIFQVNLFSNNKFFFHVQEDRLITMY